MHQVPSAVAVDLATAVEERNMWQVKIYSPKLFFIDKISVPVIRSLKSQNVKAFTNVFTCSWNTSITYKRMLYRYSIDSFSFFTHYSQYRVQYLGRHLDWKWLNKMKLKSSSWPMYMEEMCIIQIQRPSRAGALGPIFIIIFLKKLFYFFCNCPVDSSKYYTHQRHRYV
jgi:hypothetical protein